MVGSEFLPEAASDETGDDRNAAEKDMVEDEGLGYQAGGYSR